MKRDEIYWIRLEPVEGQEIGKNRPGVIVSDDLRNQHLSTVVVCSLTSVLRPKWRSRLTITCAGRKADICAEQIRTVNKGRFGKKLGKLTVREASLLRRLLSEMYGEG
jgi:mRNA interferase MazF